MGMMFRCCVTLLGWQIGTYVLFNCTNWMTLASNRSYLQLGAAWAHGMFPAFYWMFGQEDGAGWVSSCGMFWS